MNKPNEAISYYVGLSYFYKVKNNSFVRQFRSTLLVLSFGFLFSCENDRYKVDTDEVEISLKFHNADSILSTRKEPLLLDERRRLKAMDKDVYGYLFGYCYHVPVQPDTLYVQSMQRVFNDPYVKALEQEMAIHLKSTRIKHQQKLLNTFKCMKVLLPKVPQPKHVIWMNSAFTSSIFCSEQSIAIGMERYLGASSKSIQQLPENQFFQWIKDGMEPRFLPRDAVVGWLNTHAIEENNATLSEAMIRWGKLLFVTQKLMQEEDLSIVLRYSRKDLDWALASEWAVWKYLIDEQLLYDRREDTRQSLLHEGPFTRGLPQESPDRLGQFLGYRIVAQYVEDHHPTLEELLNIPYLTLLQAYEAPEKK